MTTSTQALPLANRRHDLDPEAVAQAVARKVAQIESDCLRRMEDAKALQAQYAQDVTEGLAQKRWLREPWSPEGVRQFHDGYISTEHNYYAKVRVVELPQQGPRFILVYGDADDATVDSGTGPFDTLEKAAAWFFNGGR